MSNQFLVVGSPIDHSKSPAIHRAAYRVLGLDWDYGKLEVGRGGLRQVVDNAPEALRGFSVTMPLKEEAAKLASTVDEFARTSGAANTLVRNEDGWSAYNTDVFGIVQAVRTARDQDWGYGELVAHFHGAIQHLAAEFQPSSIHFLGHSLGGQVALMQEIGNGRLLPRMF